MPTIVCATSGPTPVRMTSAPSSLTAWAALISESAISASTTGTPVTSRMTVAARCATTPWSKRSSSCSMRTRSSRPTRGITRIPASSGMSGVESSRMVASCASIICA